jgi:hypothetical protein
MEKNELINYLNEELNNIKKGFGDSYANDFIEEVDNNCRYLGDAMNEFADSHTSVYFSEQREYYYNNENECMDALNEYGYNLEDMAHEGMTLDDMICKAGAIGEYKAIYEEIAGEEGKIRQALAIKFLLDDFEIEKQELTEEQYQEIYDYIYACAEDEEPEDNADNLRAICED